MATKIEYSLWLRPFKGAQLVASIFFKVYETWKLNTNNPITNAYTAESFSPFRRILHITEPTFLAQAVLTPWQVGICYCWILRDVLSQPTWPGEIIAGIYNAHDEELSLALGVVTIKSEQPPGEVDRTLQISNDTTSSFSSNAATRTPSQTTNVTGGGLSYDAVVPERPWLQCLEYMMLWIVRNPPQDPVTSILQPGGSARWTSSYDGRVHAVIEIANEVQNDLTWQHLARCAVSLGNDVATINNWEGRVTTIYKQGSRKLVEMWVGRELDSEGADTADTFVATS